MPKWEDVKHFSYCVDLFGQEFFFCICPLLGIHYDGAGSSSIYVVYSLLLFGITMFFVLNDMRKSLRAIRKKFFLFLPFVMTLVFLVEYVITPPSGQEWTWKSYMFFILFCMPATYIGISISVRRMINKLYPHFDAIAIIMTLGIFMSIPTLLTTGVASLTGGDSTSYNTIAYSSALGFSFIYYGLLSNRQDRYPIFRTKFFRFTSVFLLLGLVFCAFSSGGRGGSLLLIIFFFYLSYSYVNRKNLFKVILGTVPVVIILTMIVSYIMSSNPHLAAAYEHGTDRAFQYISKEGVDTSKSSGRDKIYEEAIRSITENPLQVNGLFRTIGMRGYPHNFFVEILLDGGIVYFLIWMLFLFKMVMKYLRMVKSDKDLKYMSLIVLYVMTSTFFGGTYLMTGPFWFILALIYHYQFLGKNMLKKTVNISK